MKRDVLLDTGPLVAFLNAHDRYHDWAISHWAQISPPLLTCEAVISEACFLLRGSKGGQVAVIELIKRGVIHLPVRIDEHLNQITWLLEKYFDIPISLADACMVRMSELYPDSLLFTMDNDFSIYRKYKRQVIPTLLPPGL
jgi:uncharacterized protein